MSAVQIDSFVSKFKLLLNTGYNATLNLESNLGEVSIMLSCKVGRTSPPPCSPLSSCVASPKHRSPSYVRRQARRKAARDSSNVMLDAAEADHAQNFNLDEVEPTLCEEIDISDVEAVANNVNIEGEEAADEAELKKLSGDRVIDEVIFCTIQQPTEKKEIVEEEIKLRLENAGVTVMKMHTFCNDRGYFDQSRVKISPVNMKDIIGQRLGLTKCRIMECNPPPSSSKVHHLPSICV